MPARKPQSLIARHDTTAEKQARVERESALRPGKPVPLQAPARLKGHKVAVAAWRRTMRIYNSLEGEIVTRLDMELLVDYCLLIEQLSEMDMLRKSAMANYDMMEKKKQEHIKAGKVEEALVIAKGMTGVFDAIVKLDARADRKRALIFQKQQSMYLTPRARAGFAPAQKDEPEPLDDMEKLLGDVNDYLNGKGDGQ